MARGGVRWPDLRPLDPVRSIKAKLALLVAASISVSALLTFVSLTVFGWRARYGLTVAVLVGLAVSQLLARGMTSPLRQMTAAAREMAAGRAPGPVSTSSRDEVGDLARAFTSMADDLASADVQRRDLLANVAHELRTPVAALRAQVENLVDGVREPDGAALVEVLVQVEHLGGLVDDLLGLARAEAGVVPLLRRPVHLAELAGSVVEETRLLRPECVVRLDVPADLVVEADAARLRQVLANLVDNATRHAASEVVVSAMGTGAVGVAGVGVGAFGVAGVGVAGVGVPGGGVRIEVADDGPGIPEAERAAVFERFRRHAVGEARGSGGTGLGLAIARWAVGLHGGRIEVVPSAVGCRVRVDLPGPGVATGPDSAAG